MTARKASGPPQNKDLGQAGDAANPNAAEAAIAEGGTPEVAHAVAEAGGASNRDDQVAAGMPAASEAADKALADVIEDAVGGRIPTGFVAAGNGMLRATKDVSVEIPPAPGNVRKRTILIAARGSEQSRDSLTRTFATFRQSGAKVTTS